MNKIILSIKEQTSGVVITETREFDDEKYNKTEIVSHGMRKLVNSHDSRSLIITQLKQWHNSPLVTIGVIASAGDYSKNELIVYYTSYSNNGQPEYKGEANIILI